jgi:hypothetical protein
MTADAPVHAPETELAFDMAKRALPIAPAIVLAGLAAQGWAGACSALLAVGIVVLNLIVAAASLAWAARRSPNLLMVTALFGFLARMLILTGIVYLVKGEPWINLPTLAIAILVTHLGLLFWEMRYVSATLAFPALAPSATSKGA